jgi:hypothetical protein
MWKVEWYSRMFEGWTPLRPGGIADTKEQAAALMCKHVFDYPSYQWRLIDPQGNVVTE